MGIPRIKRTWTALKTCGDAAEEFQDLAQRLAAMEAAAGGAPLLSVAEHAPCDEVPAWCSTLDL